MPRPPPTSPGLFTFEAIDESCFAPINKWWRASSFPECVDCLYCDGVDNVWYLGLSDPPTNPDGTNGRCNDVGQFPWE